MRHGQPGDARLQSAMQYSGVGMALVAPDGSFLEVNDALCAMLGRDEAELRAATWQQMTHPDDVAADVALLEEVLTGVRDGYRLTKRYLRPDGTVVHGDLSVVGMRGPGGRVEYLISQVVDTTDEVQLREHLRLLADHTTDVVALTDEQGTVTWVSDSITKAAGWAPAELVGLRYDSFIHVDDLPMLMAQQQRLLADGAVELELRMRYKDGGHHWVRFRLSPVRDDDGTLVGQILAGWDAEDEHRARAALRASEEKIRAALDAQADAHVFLDAVRDEAGRVVDFVLIDTNQATLDYFQRERSSLVGSSIAAMLPLAHAERLCTAYTHTVETGEPIVVDSWRAVPRPNEKQRYFDLRGVKVGDGISLSAREVTARVRAVEALEASERQAHDLATRYERARDAALGANAAKTAFLSRMSHELRTPLNAILGFAQLLALEPLTPDQQDFVTQVRSSGRHLLDLVTEVLDVSRIEAGGLTLSMEPVSVDDAIDQSLDLVRPQAMAAGVTVRRGGCHGCVSHVWADRQRVIQVLANLASNGIKYNRAGGCVEISRAAGDPDTVMIRVSDTGAGLHPDQLTRLFEPFERLGAEESAIEGTGIGLALSQGLAVAMGGRIEVESTVGEGSVFSLVLPGSHVAGDDPGTQEVRRAVAARPVDVLYIEDNSANQHLMSHIVRLRPTVTLRLADDGTSGLRAARERTPDLVLLDLHLPDIRGDEVLRGLRSDAALAAVPVVVVTADATPDLDDRLLRLGATGVITKPVDVDHVLDWIDHAVEDGR